MSSSAGLIVEQMTSHPSLVERHSEPRPLSVLNLVPNPATGFFCTQVESLRSVNVRGEILSTFEAENCADPETYRSPMDYVRFFPEVRRTLRPEHDIVHANFGLTGPHALAQRRVPVVLSLWGTDVYGPFGWVSKLCARLCDAVIVPSEEMGEQLDCEYTVIPHGVDLDQFTPAPRSAAVNALGWDPDSVHVLFPGNTNRPEKDFPRAERIVGAARKRVDAPIRIHTPNGAVPHDEMPTWMNASDVLLLTSQYEGSPNVIKEAMACNVPIVSSDVGDVPERLADVSPSAVCSTDDELVAALVETLRADARSNGRQVVSDLRIDRMADRIRSVYDEVLTGDR